MSRAISTITHFIAGFFSLKNYTLRNYTAYLLVIMCIQYIPIESRAGVSPVKVLTMVLTPLIFLRYFTLNKGVFLTAIYGLWILFSASIINEDKYRPSTIIYLWMFLLTYMAFYTFINNQRVFTIKFFIRFVKGFIMVLFCTLIVQQAFLVIGIKYFPLINLCQILDRGIGANSLSYEPSSAARTFAVLYYAYLKCNEYVSGRKLSFLELFRGEHKSTTLMFLWSMLTMGSGTAFICLGILSLYFMRGAYTLLAIPILAGVIAVMSSLEIKQFERAYTVTEATLDGEDANIREADVSASTRITPILNTIYKMDLSKTETWVGEGTDTGLSYRASGKRLMGDINDYGFIAFLLSLCLVFGCAIRFFSLGTIMFFLGLGGSTSNNAYGWGLLMIFTCVTYFYHLKQKNQLLIEDA